MPLEEEQNNQETQEPVNMDQTDFFDNSSFSLSEKEVFPDADQSSATIKTNPKPTNPLIKLLIIGAVIIGVLLIVLAVVLLYQNSQANPEATIFPTNNLSPAQEQLNEVRQKLEVVTELNQQFLLPQFTDKIIP